MNNQSQFKPLSLLALTTLFILSGCRFGNHSENAIPLKNPSQYKSIEFFYTAPKTFTTRVYLNSLGGPDMVVHSNTAAPLSTIPSSILNALSNPVYLAVPNNPNQFPIFRDYRDSTSLVTDLDQNGNIVFDYIPDDGPYVLWNNPNCITNFQITQNGTLDRSQPGEIQYEDGTTAAVSGSMRLSYTFSRVIGSINGASNCDNDLNRLALCYDNGTGCSADELSAARSLFDLYARQTGVLDIQDASRIKGLEYIIEYE
jgi:hypothetical protein